MAQLQLSEQLIRQTQAHLVEHDDQARDPLVAAQYLSALIGCLLARPMPEEVDRPELLGQMFAFSEHVMNDVLSRQKAAPVPQQQVFGVWKPDE